MGRSATQKKKIVINCTSKQILTYWVPDSNENLAFRGFITIINVLVPEFYI